MLSFIFFHKETVSVLDEDNLNKAKRTGSAAAFATYFDGVDYTFKKSESFFVDDQSGSTWDITGFCREGKMKGKQLELLPQTNHFAFAYLAFFPNAKIYNKK